MTTSHLDLTNAELREGLTACLAVPRWVDEVAARAPYASIAELLEVARAAATPLSPAEVDQAMAHHPRIGEKPSGAGTAQEFSRAEQASSESEDAELASAFGDQAALLAEKESSITEELLAVQGEPVDIGGYYRPDDEKATAVMRPSATFNEALAPL